MAPAQDLGLTRGLEQLAGVLADRLEHREPGLAGGPAQRADEALVDERRQGLEDIEPVLAADRLSRLEGPAAGEHGEPREERALVLVQEAVAPLERRPEGALASGQVVSPADEQVERPVEATVHRLGRQELGARGGQLDRKGQPVEPRAYLRDRGNVALVELELRVDGARPRREKAHSIVRHELLEAHMRPRFGDSERRDGVLVLAGEAERRSARREHEQPGRGREETGDELDVRYELLEVVEQQEHAAVAELGREHVLHALGGLARAERLSE